MSENQAPPQSTSAPLDFEKADFGSAAASVRSCLGCKQPITGSYYEVAGRIVCPSCRNRVAEQIGDDGAGRVMAAGLWGLGAAAIGAGIYFGLQPMGGSVLVAFGVGWLIGKAVHRGAHGVGGRTYQILAALLTYLALGAAHAIGVFVSFPEGGFGAAFVQGIQAPIRQAKDSVIMIITIGVALYEAWQLNRPVPITITGPYQPGPLAPVVTTSA